MKNKPFLKVISIVITLGVVSTFGLVRTTEAQTCETVADHNLEVESDYEYFSMEYRSTAYFEIKFDIKAVKGTSTKDVEIILKADEYEGDYEVEDNNTFIYYLGVDAYSSSMTSYNEIGPYVDGDIDIPAFSSLFLRAASDADYDWIDYEWAGSKIERITVFLVAGTASTTDLLKIKWYKFESTPGGTDHDDSQDFGYYDSLSGANWDIREGAPIVDTSDDTLYLRPFCLAFPETVEICDGKDNDCDGVIPANEIDKDGDGFMICEGDCDDSDNSVYPGASGTYKGKDNNCNGIIDKDEKRRFSYSLDTRLFPLWMQSQQLGILPFIPPYPDCPPMQKQMWYPYQLTLSQQQSVKTKSYFFHPALFTWLLNLDYSPFYSSFMAFNMGAQYDINFNPYLNSIIYNPFVFASRPDNQTTQIITLLSIEIEASDIILKIIHEDGCGTFRETAHLTYYPNTSNTFEGTAQLTVTGYYSDGSIIDLTNDACTIYVSSNQDVVEVENDGKVTAVGEGEATITVTNSGITDQIIIEVEDDTFDIPNVKRNWAGTWEAWLTDPNEVVVTDPNGQPIITMSGDIRFHFTDQETAIVSGTIEITGWNVDPPPQNWPGDWTGESDEVRLAGWIDQFSKYLKARYFYYSGKEEFGDYDENDDYENIKGMYTWMFDSNKLTITETCISGQFNISGTDGYYKIGAFSMEKVDAQ